MWKFFFMFKANGSPSVRKCNGCQTETTHPTLVVGTPKTRVHQHVKHHRGIEPRLNKNSYKLLKNIPNYLLSRDKRRHQDLEQTESAIRAHSTSDTFNLWVLTRDRHSFFTVDETEPGFTFGRTRRTSFL